MFCSPWMDRIGVRSLKAAGSMATISICLAKQPVIHMSASVWQTMRLGQSQWQSVDWSFSIMFIQLFQCFQLQKRDSFVLIIFCSHLCECHESSDRVDLHKKKAEEWQSCKREETCNPKWLTDPETILGYPWLSLVWPKRDGYAATPWDSQTQDWLWTNLPGWNPARLSGLWHLDDLWHRDPVGSAVFLMTVEIGIMLNH